MILKYIEDNLWEFVFLPLFSICSLTLLLRFRLLPFRRFGLMLRVTLGGREEKGGGLSSLQAACTALSATVGTGNIIGTAQALSMGGPGAIFWLWIAALLGMSVKYAEIYLGQRFGSAMGYIHEALGKTAAGIYAALAVFSALTMGNMTQMNSAVSAICTVFEGQHMPLPLIMTAVLSLAAFAALAGGAEKIGKISSILVPMMALGFLTASGAVIVFRWKHILPAMRWIIEDAFTGRAVLGAAGGLGVKNALLWGLRRSCFSNEAGIGTAANVHAAVQSHDPSLHALWGVFEVFADTLVFCSLTALAILCSGVQIPFGSLPGTELLQNAFSVFWGKQLASVFLAAALFLFAYTTVIGTSAVGLACAEYLAGKDGKKMYRGAFLCCCVIGGLAPNKLIWNIADVSNVLLTLPNLLSILLFAPVLGKAVQEAFFEKRRMVSCPEEKKGVI